MDAGVSIGVLVRIPDNSQETTNTTTTVTIRILDFVKTRPRYSPWDGLGKFDRGITTVHTNSSAWAFSRKLVIFNYMVAITRKFNSIRLQVSEVMGDSR